MKKTIKNHSQQTRKLQPGDVILGKGNEVEFPIIQKVSVVAQRHENMNKPADKLKWKSNFDMAKDCMVCGKRIGYRGFCSLKCHNGYYDKLEEDLKGEQEK